MNIKQSTELVRLREILDDISKADARGRAAVTVAQRVNSKLYLTLNERYYAALSHVRGTGPRLAGIRAAVNYCDTLRDDELVSTDSGYYIELPIIEDFKPDRSPRA